MAFSDNLKTLRKCRGFSQEELAQIVGISQPTLAQYELGIKFPNIITAVNWQKAHRVKERMYMSDKTVPSLVAKQFCDMVLKWLEKPEDTNQEEISCK